MKKYVTKHGITVEIRKIKKIIAKHIAQKYAHCDYKYFKQIYHSSNFKCP